MFKVTPNPPDTDPASPYESLDSKKLHEAAERALDHYLNPAANIMATPRTPGTMFIVNPELDTETLLAHACESLASANVMAMDLVDHLEGSSRNSLLGIAQVSSKVCDYNDVLAHPQIASNGMLVELHHPQHGVVRVPGFPINSLEAAQTPYAPAPDNGQHSRYGIAVNRALVGVQPPA